MQAPWENRSQQLVSTYIAGHPWQADARGNWLRNLEGVQFPVSSNPFDRGREPLFEAQAPVAPI